MWREAKNGDTYVHALFFFSFLASFSCVRGFRNRLQRCFPSDGDNLVLDLNRVLIFIKSVAARRASTCAHEEHGCWYSTASFKASARVKLPRTRILSARDVVRVPWKDVLDMMIDKLEEC